ncbi:hypothetical protein A2J03_24095 [Rhodococcus sp. EPR-157]|nr:hypothetical protein A2J03_24095 [Rhodococcus sp. EPR-157]
MEPIPRGRRGTAEEPWVDLATLHSRAVTSPTMSTHSSIANSSGGQRDKEGGVDEVFSSRLLVP